MPLSMSQTRKTSPCPVSHVLLMNYFCIFEETSIKDLFLLRNNHNLPKQCDICNLKCSAVGEGIQRTYSQRFKMDSRIYIFGFKKYFTHKALISNLFIFHQKYCKRLPQIKCMRLEIHIERFYPQGEPINNIRMSSPCPNPNSKIDSKL